MYESSVCYRFVGIEHPASDVISVYKEARRSTFHVPEELYAGELFALVVVYEDRAVLAAVEIKEVLELFLIHYVVTISSEKVSSALLRKVTDPPCASACECYRRCPRLEQASPITQRGSNVGRGAWVKADVPCHHVFHKVFFAFVVAAPLDEPRSFKTFSALQYDYPSVLLQ